MTNDMKTVLSAMYAPNDRLGVELMGAINWNALKKAVTRATQKAVNKSTGGVSLLQKANAALNRANVATPLKYWGSSKNLKTLNGTVCGELLGMNEPFCSELLGYSLSDLTRQVKNLTHQALEVGEKIPVIDAAVARVRDIEDVITGSKKAVDVAQNVTSTVYDNRGKIILGGAALAFLIYILTRKKR